MYMGDQGEWTRCLYSSQLLSLAERTLIRNCEPIWSGIIYKYKSERDAVVCRMKTMRSNHCCSEPGIERYSPLMPYSRKICGPFAQSVTGPGGVLRRSSR